MLTISIAGLTIALVCPDDALAERLRCRYEPFLSTASPRLTIHPSSLILALEATEQLLRVAYARLAFDAGGLLVHAAAVACGPRGYLFLGPSGAGKTTVARNSPAGRLLNDDLVLLMPDNGGWAVQATPFSNPTQLAPPGPAQAALAALLHLVQDTRVARLPMSPAVATAALAARAPVVGFDPERAESLLGRARAITAAARSDYLHFRPDPSFWSLIEPAS